MPVTYGKRLNLNDTRQHNNQVVLGTADLFDLTKLTEESSRGYPPKEPKGD